MDRKMQGRSIAAAVNVAVDKQFLMSSSASYSVLIAINASFSLLFVIIAFFFFLYFSLNILSLLFAVRTTLKWSSMLQIVRGMCLFCLHIFRYNHVNVINYHRTYTPYTYIAFIFAKTCKKNNDKNQRLAFLKWKRRAFAQHKNKMKKKKQLCRRKENKYGDGMWTHTQYSNTHTHTYAHTWRTYVFHVWVINTYNERADTSGQRCCLLLLCYSMLCKKACTVRLTSLVYVLVHNREFRFNKLNKVELGISSVLYTYHIRCTYIIISNEFFFFPKNSLHTNDDKS